MADDMPKGSNEYMAAMDDMRDFMSFIEGSKRYLIDRGWSDQGAEAVVLQMLQASVQRGSK